MSEFKSYHPFINFIYFVFVIGFSCVFMHPVCLLFSLTASFTYSVMLKGKKAIKTNLKFALPSVLLLSVINPLFNHKGITIISYLPGGNPLTLESVVYGVLTGVMIASVIFYFSCYNEVMTSDKFICLFGKIIPSLSLVFSMTLRFVPRFFSQFKVIANAQRCLGRDISKGNIINRAKNAVNILSAMTTWSFENSIQTADSMKARGYGLPKRTSFSIFTFDKRDKIALFCILFLAIFVFCGSLAGKMDFHYFPSLQGAEISAFGGSVFLAYLLLCFFPVIIEVLEARRWRA